MTAASRTTKLLGLLTAGLLTTALACACGGGPSPACQTATAKANAYAGWVWQNTAYPNDSITEGMAIQAHELSLIDAMTKAGCPGTTKIATLPGS